MKQALRRLRTAAVALGACSLGLSLLSVPAAEAYSVPTSRAAIRAGTRSRTSSRQRV